MNPPVRLISQVVTGKVTKVTLLIRSSVTIKRAQATCLRVTRGFVTENSGLFAGSSNLTTPPRCQVNPTMIIFTLQKALTHVVNS